MKVNFLFVVTVFCGFSSCDLLSINSQLALQNPLNEVTYLIEDWNKKHSEASDIVVIGVQENSDFIEKITKVIPKRNAIVITRPSYCTKIQKRPGFIVIELVIFDNVTFISVPGKQCFRS